MRQGGTGLISKWAKCSIGQTDRLAARQPDRQLGKQPDRQAGCVGQRRLVSVPWYFFQPIFYSFLRADGEKGARPCQELSLSRAQTGTGPNEAQEIMELWNHLHLFPTANYRRCKDVKITIITVLLCTSIHQKAKYH